MRLKHKVSQETVWIHAVITKFPKLTVRSEDLVLVSFQNITEQKQLLNELSNLNETKDKFFSIIAHDLRSPFAGILGFLELLTQEDVADFSNKEVQVIMKNMLDTTKLTFDLLENLLTWARSQSEALNFEPEYFDIQPLVFKIVELLRPNAKQKQINVFIKDVESVQVFADSYMVETIVRNLLSNAIKFTPEKGTISFKTEIDSNTEEVIISVKDTGVGISESVMEKIFSLDRNITTLGTNKEKGTGLGLHLCKEFVEKNGGNIFVESNVEQGTVISFTLPLATKKMRFNFSN